MRVDIVTIFPDMVEGALGHSILARARQDGLVTIDVVDLRDFTADKRRTVDDAPYGGGAGMVLKPEPVFDAVESLIGPRGVEQTSPEFARDGGLPAEPRARVILMSPQGRTLTQGLARELAAESRLILICGHYEGFDERIREHLVDDEVSIGDYVLTGGELAALVLVDCVARLVPGVLGNCESLGSESFDGDLLEYPQYTRPATYRNWSVPEVLLSGHHAEIEKWRLAEREKRTMLRRPDLWARHAAAKPAEEKKDARRRRAPIDLEAEDAVPGKQITQETTEENASIDCGD